MPADDKSLIGIVFPFPRAITAIVECTIVNLDMNGFAPLNTRLLFLSGSFFSLQLESWTIFQRSRKICVWHSSLIGCRSSWLCSSTKLIHVIECDPLNMIKVLLQLCRLRCCDLVSWNILRSADRQPKRSRGLSQKSMSPNKFHGLVFTRSNEKSSSPTFFILARLSQSRATKIAGNNKYPNPFLRNHS